MAEAHKQAEIASRTPDFMVREASKPFGWGAARGAARERVLDVGCGSGWTSLFLARAGYSVTGVDLVPANVRLTRARAEEWGVDVDARVADMDALDLGAEFDFVLVYDALHHSARQADAVRGVARHLAPGAWSLFGEPSWLHRFSPGARAVTASLGWMERGVSARGLLRDCAAAGLGEFRRFFGGTAPYESRGRGFVWQVARLVAANVLVAPQALIWLAARRPARNP
jgi:SAM-dependent methyltransferase